jgi:NAD(P)-dependent dehydrogenase (short-subunit alcohol dehydrogenase family)
MGMPRRYEGRVGLVTGAASGVGAATARRLAAEGAAVHLVDLSEDALDAVVGDLTRAGQVATSSIADVSDRAQVEAAVDACVSAHGRLDAVANNAGIYIGNALDAVTPEEWDRVMAVNLTGTFLVAQAAAPPMGEGGGGAITNVASVYGQIGDTFDPMASYAASKAGVAACTRQLAVELAPLGIRVNAICPGMVDTAMNADWKADADAWQGFIETKIPAGRVATADEAAALHAFLGSDEASYVTAALVHLDGGWSAT